LPEIQTSLLSILDLVASDAIPYLGRIVGSYSNHLRLLFIIVFL